MSLMMQQDRPSGLTLGQEQALAICPKISAIISIPCSCLLISQVWNEHYSHSNNKKKSGGSGGGRGGVQERILVAMSVIDILASLAWFCSTWAVPESSGFVYAAGNQTTCNIQGLLLQLAIGAPLYNSSLALFYLLMIKVRRWKNEDLIKMERCVHLVIITFVIGTSFLLLPLQQYNHVGAVCWITGEPTDCGNSSFHSNPEVPCERGNYSWVYGLALFYVPLWISVIACSVCMFCLYLEVRNTHRKSQSYLAQYGAAAIQQQQALQGRSGHDTNKVAIQAILYCLSFLITWMPSTAWSVAHWFSVNNGAGGANGIVVYVLSLSASIAEPLQGLWTFLIFLRSRPKLRAKIHQTMTSLFTAVVPSSSRQIKEGDNTSSTSTAGTTKVVGDPDDSSRIILNCDHRNNDNNEEEGPITKPILPDEESTKESFA